MSQHEYQIGEAARISGVSIRTLRHYEDIKLLVPSARTQAGYRLYTDDDLLRLQHILVGRELGLPLQRIAQLLDDPSIDRRELLLEQRAELASRVHATQAMIRSIDAALALDEEQQMTEVTTMQMKGLFEGFDPAEHEEEVRQRWGNTEAYRESARRAKRYSAEDWKVFKTEWEAILQDAAAALSAGKRPEEPEVIAIAERHRMSIDRWFYACSPSMHRALADMWEADDRFATSIDRWGRGLTPFLAAAVRANAKGG